MGGTGSHCHNGGFACGGADGPRGKGLGLERGFQRSVGVVVCGGLWDGVDSGEVCGDVVRVIAMWILMGVRGRWW